MLHFEVVGKPEGRVVLLVHGFMGCAADWHPTMQALSTDFRCIAVDLPGHGASVGLPDTAYTMDGAMRELLEVLDAANLDCCVLVGYSMGGRLALYMALNYPERFAGLVLESASPGLQTQNMRAERRAVDAKRAEQIRADFHGFLRQWYRQPLFASLDIQPERVERLGQIRFKQDPIEVARSLEGMGTGQQPSLWERLRGLQVSTLAMTGQRDAKYVEIARQMEAGSPQIGRVVVPEAGHTVHLEQPSAFLGHLQTFLLQSYR